MKSLLLAISLSIFFMSGCANVHKAPKRNYEKDYILCLNEDKSFSLTKETEIFRVKPKSYPFKKEFFNCNITYSDIELKVRSSSMGEFSYPIKVDKSDKCKSFIKIYEDNSVIYKIVEFDKLKEAIKEGLKYEVPTFKEYTISNPITLGSCISLKKDIN